MPASLLKAFAGMFVAIATLVACGGGGSSASKPTASNAPSSSQNCTDRVVAMLNSFDVSKIDPSDGLDDRERSDVDNQFSSYTKDQPDLASDGPCDKEFQNLSADQAQAVIARIRPEVAAVLGASARSTFSTVASSIN